MEKIFENWKRFLIEDMWEPRTITFDFDDTIMMLRPSEDWGSVVDGPNKKIINLMKKHKKMGDRVIIVTSRLQNRETGGPWEEEHPAYMPSVQEYIDKYNLPVEQVVFTNGDLKAQHLLKLRSDLHFDDDEQELAAANEVGIKTVQVRNMHYSQAPDEEK
jgi:FMN phosphatase YigB (HAD superfamily)